MPKPSLDELKGRVAAGQYAVDARVLAGDIVWKLSLIRRLRRLLMSEDEGRATELSPASPPRRQRGPVPGARRRSPRGERPSRPAR